MSVNQRLELVFIEEIVIIRRIITPDFLNALVWLSVIFQLL